MKTEAKRLWVKDVHSEEHEIPHAPHQLPVKETIAHTPHPPMAHAPHHLPPHMRHEMLRITFDPKDWEVLRDVFGNDDNAAVAAEIIKNAPPEIQITIMQTINMIEEVK